MAPEPEGPVVDAQWAGMPEWAVRWTGDHSFDLKVARTADRPVIRESRTDGPVECRVLTNRAGRLTGYSFTFAQNEWGPRFRQYRNSVVAAYAREPPWPAGLAVVMTGPHVRVLRVGDPEGPAIYQIVFRHVDREES